MLRNRIERLERAAALTTPAEFEDLPEVRAMNARLAAHPAAAAKQAELDAILERLARRTDLPADVTRHNLFLLDPRACALACDLDALASAPEEPAP